jgi:outer membrane protein OmpA-like peptidoglycan-associated protein
VNRTARYIPLLLLVFISRLLWGQSLSQVEASTVRKPYLRVGAYGMFAQNYHDSKGNVYCCDVGCGVFGNGTGKGLGFGLLLDAPVIPMLEISARIGYGDRSGDLGFSTTSDPVVLDPKYDNYPNLYTEHHYTATLPQVLGELGVKINPFEDFPIYLRTGFHVNLPLEGGTSYEQTDEITSPDGVTWNETKTTMRTVGNGEIKNMSTSFGVHGGIGYPFPLSDVLTAAPEFNYYYPLTEMKDDFDWKLKFWQAGVAIRWNFIEEEPAPPPPPPPPPPIVVEKKPEPVPPQPYIGLASDEVIKVVETNVTETFPLLPYVFFDSASSAISSRYQTATSRAQFDEGGLPHNSLGAYYYMLQVVASRLAAKPDAKLTITGTTDGKEVSKGELTNLSRTRAEAVRDYLTNTWNIDPARIKVSTASVPTFPSSLKESAGSEENRRVEISSNDESIMAPIVHEQFKEYEITPKALPFSASVRTFAPAKDWTFRITAGAEEIHTMTGKGEPPQTLSWKLDNATAERIARKVQSKENFKCELSVKDETNTVGKTGIELPVEKTIFPFELSRLSLVVFDFDKADITPVNQKMVRSFVAKNIQQNSTVAITGTTDAMGELDHNKELSTSRAFSVHELIKKENPVAEITKVQGNGPNESPEMNNTPEGRYYCRTVTVQVQTPLK